MTHRTRRHVEGQVKYCLHKRLAVVLLVAVGLFFAVICFFVGAPRPVRALASSQSPNAICPGSGALEGVDVSDFKGVIDWSPVAAAGKVFAYARVGDGDAYTDTTFITNYIGIKSAGMQAGGYWFFHPDQDPAQQAGQFVGRLVQAGYATGDLAPMLDVETTGGQISTTIASHLQTALSVVESSLHVIPVIYTNPAFWNASVGSSAFGGYPLWTANFNVSCPAVPTAWSNWVLWQYTDSGSVAGISGFVDLDRSNGAVLPKSAPPAFLPAVLDDAP